MNETKKTINNSLLAVCINLLSAFILYVLGEVIKNYCEIPDQIYIKTWQGLLVVILVVILLVNLLIYICKIRSKNRIYKECINIPTIASYETKALGSTNALRHSILLVDDQARYRNMYSSILMNYNSKAVENIMCPELIYEFDIVIVDMIGVGISGNATEMLKAVKRQYPYKYLIAMSTDSANFHLCSDYYQKAICKMPQDTFNTRLFDMINEAMKELDSPYSYWQKVSDRLLKSPFTYPLEKIQECKREYEIYLYRKKNSRSHL